MFDGGMTFCFQAVLKSPPIVLLSNPIKIRCPHVKRSISVQTSSVFFQTDESNRNLAAPNKCKIQVNTVGIIGGVSVFSTLIFLEKLVWLNSKSGEQRVPLVVYSDPRLDQWLSFEGTISFHPSMEGNAEMGLAQGDVIQKLRRKRAFLEESGASCIVMPCHVSHAWHEDIVEGSSKLFLNLGECVTGELKEVNLKPLVTGNHVRIGVLATHDVLNTGFYQKKLQNQGFEVVVPDRRTIEHILIPAVEAFRRKDIEGARNLLRIGIQILLVRAVNVVILASDELVGLLPHDDPLLEKCVDPMDALARATLKWAKEVGT